MPVGPVLQALYANPESAKAMKYRQEQTRNMARDFLGAHGSDPNRIFEDLMSGDDYQKLVADGAIDDDDILLMLSMDGAQLYEHKISDCWIYILVILELSPDKRYKKRHVIPGGFIPGPKKPKNIDSFLFPGLYHIACLQKEDFRVYDSDLCTPIRKFPKAILKTAVGPGMACLNGLVGHNGARGCRIYCKVPSRHRDSHTHYYPVLLKPDNFAVARSDHGDVNLKTYSPYSSQESTTKSNSRTTNSTTEKPEVPDVVDGHQIDVLVNNPQAAQLLGYDIGAWSGTAGRTGKQDRTYTASPKTITPENLCGVDWVAENKKGKRADFAQYWREEISVRDKLAYFTLAFQKTGFTFKAGDIPLNLESKGKGGKTSDFPRILLIL